MTDREEEITAWHESGHAFVAAWLGATVESVSIDPDADDGPQRFGDIVVRWDRGRFSDREIAEKSVLVALSGPVTEMIHRDDPLHPATVSEWSQDWLLAWTAADFIRDQRQRMAHLEQITQELYHLLSQDHHWAAIGAIVDHLLAYETLEGETIHEIVSEWT
jgi:ATP-dependent Zn protease